MIPVAVNAQNYAAVLQYDGTAYRGWQRQGGRIPTVQGCLAAVLSRLAGSTVPIAGSGRTDAGVHALGQVASFESGFRPSLGELWNALNALLPPDIRVSHLGLVPPGFHARYSAVAKTYFYQVHLGPFLPPQRYRSFLHERGELDLTAMRRAATHLVGRIDCRSFSTACTRRIDTVRQVKSMRILRVPSGVRIFVTADGFLYNMVRGLAAVLLAVGRGKLAPDDVRQLRDAADRRLAPPTPPAHGLFLWRVAYPLSLLVPEMAGAGGGERRAVGTLVRGWRLGSEGRCVEDGRKQPLSSCRSAWLTGFHHDVTSRNARGRTREETPRES
ncbi:MAG: tRNA pseudouridine(38-40) synthase TruA [Planctomycetota bacterium]